jgi:hypothetical protein
MALQNFIGLSPLIQLRNHFSQTVGILHEWSASRKAATYTPENTTTEQTHTDIHALSGIEPHDPSVRAHEDSLCLRPRGHSDRWKLFLHAQIPPKTLQLGATTWARDSANVRRTALGA